MYFADIHCHILYGVDDGAENEAEMYDMLDCAYNAGIRILCVTPHHAPDLFPHPQEKENCAFEKLSEYANAKYPDLTLRHGNEVFVYSDIPSALKEGKAYLLSERGHILIEFSPDRTFEQIARTVDRISLIGYIPVIAHIERYKALDIKNTALLKEHGAVISVNAESVTSANGKRLHRKVIKLIKQELVDIVASDAHRADAYISFSDAYRIILQKFGALAAEKLFYSRAASLINPVLPTKKIRS